MSVKTGTWYTHCAEHMVNTLERNRIVIRPHSKSPFVRFCESGGWRGPLSRPSAASSSESLDRGRSQRQRRFGERRGTAVSSVFRSLSWLARLGSADPKSGRIQNSDVVKTEPDPPAAVLHRLYTHYFSLQGVGHEYVLGSPAYLSTRGNPPHLPAFRVLDLGQAARIRSRRRCVAGGRRGLPQRFVGSLLVVLPSELVEASLLRSTIAGRRTSRGLLQRAMHPFMPAVLLRLGRLNPLRHDP